MHHMLFFSIKLIQCWNTA